MTDPRRIEYISLRKLRADPRNPKAHDADAIEHSVERFGFLEPVVIDERTGYMVSGHGRVSVLTALRMAGAEPPEGVKVTGKGDWKIPVVVGWSSASDAEAGAALIALNRTTELGGWVDEALLDLLQEIEDAADDDLVDAVAFDDDAVAALRAVVEEADVATRAEPVADVKPDPKPAKVTCYACGQEIKA